jgi:AAA family ATP:ADP antiporter
MKAKVFKPIDEPPPSSQPSEEEWNQHSPINQGLLTRRRKRIRNELSSAEQREWMRPYWLGFGLFLLLFAFWTLDSLKDPVFARLVDGNLDRHQPPAKLLSVATTLLLVCLMEYFANLRQRAEERWLTPEPEILDPGGIWNSMPMSSSVGRNAPDDNISISLFTHIGVPYAIVFLIMAYLLNKFESLEEQLEKGFDLWYILAYILYATIESFGSLTVATFWSYTNSTLSLNDAEQYYGTIIAIAQLGAIGGSTIVASDYWKAPLLLTVVSLIIVLQLVMMKLYDGRFEPTSILANDDDVASRLTWQDDNVTITKPFWSGLYLIIRNNYVLLILGVSCLYEISLTCLDYQMKLLGWARFEVSDSVSMSFLQFMGRYGQVVNMMSLFFSSIIFPFLIRRYGLRITLRFFPTLLLVVTIVAYGAIPGNLTVLFFSLSVLKAMTYSVHDPSKEILYIPTSNAVKFRAKFWIDVVGERISKAIGSAFNTFAGSVDRSVQIGSVPSLLSAVGLWIVSYYAGIEFDRLLRTGKIVGLDQSIDPETYKRIPKDEREIEIEFSDEGDNVSTLGLASVNERFQGDILDSIEQLSGLPSQLPSVVRL